MRRRLLLVLAPVLFLGACTDERQDVWSPEGEFADKVIGVQWGVFVAAYVVGLLVAGAFVFIVIRYRVRRRKGDDGEVEEVDRPDPVQVHGNFRLEIAWTIIPAAILAAVALFSVPTIFAVRGAQAFDERNLSVSVFGQQWWWSFEYDLDDDGEPEIVTASDLVIPADADVELIATSRDVIHSFWAPSLSGTIDVVPGREHRIVIQAGEPGVFDVQCKEYCGLAHAYMRARVIALSDSEFATWLDQQQQEWEEPDDPDALAGRDVFVARCAQCHVINGLRDAEGNEVELDVEAMPLLSGHAPNLTHLMSRGVFASGLLPLYDEDGNLNRPDLEQWLRNPDSLVPQNPDNEQGMPDLGLTEGEIDQLVAFLQTLGEPPPGAGG
ncbi:MAG: cytochrome c oxidase subunit II [Acidimicrobiales bacterium]